jgi:hypothetical protein
LEADLRRPLEAGMRKRPAEAVMESEEPNLPSNLMEVAVVVWARSAGGREVRVRMASAIRARGAVGPLMKAPTARWLAERVRWRECAVPLEWPRGVPMRMCVGGRMTGVVSNA